MSSLDHNNALTERDLENINRRFDEIDEGIKRIEGKQDYTNGRVNALERTNIYVRGFIGALAFVIGLPAVIGTVLGVIIALQQMP